MSNVTTLPVRGEVFADDRGDGRTLRVNWHPDAGAHGLVILSLWRDGTCVCTFRLRSDDVALLVDTLTRGAAVGPAAPPTATGYRDPRRTGQVSATFASSRVSPSDWPPSDRPPSDRPPSDWPPSDRPPPNTPGAGSWSA
jgi:hypothetical protein